MNRSTDTSTTAPTVSAAAESATPGGAAPPASATTRRRSPGRIGMLVAVAVATLALAACTPPEWFSADDEPSPEPQPTETVDDEEPEPEPAPLVRIELPDDCIALIPSSILSAFDDVPLNHTSYVEQGLPSGISNERMRERLEEHRELGCVWRDPDAISTGLTTTIARISGGDAAQSIMVLQGAGAACYLAHNGTRCELDTSSASVVDGETHFFRDDIWIATAWSDLAPSGYTAGLSSTIWGD